MYDNCDNEDQTVDILYHGFTDLNDACNGQGTNTTAQTYAGTVEKSLQVIKYMYV